MSDLSKSLSGTGDEARHILWPASAAVVAGVCEGAVAVAPVARTVRIVVVQEDVLGRGTGAYPALPVAAGTAATMLRPKAMSVAVRAFILPCTGLVKNSPLLADE